MIKTQFDNVSKDNVEKALKTIFNDYKAKVCTIEDAEYDQKEVEKNLKKAENKLKETKNLRKIFE